MEQAIATWKKLRSIRNSEEGYKLFTVQEKTWDTRRDSLDPLEADRNRIRREILKEIFSDPELRAYRFHDLRTFRNTLVVDGDTVESDGDIPLNLLVAESPQQRTDRLAEARDESNRTIKHGFLGYIPCDELHEHGGGGFSVPRDDHGVRANGVPAAPNL